MSSNAWLRRRAQTSSVMAHVGLQHPSSEPVLSSLDPFCPWLARTPAPMFWEVGPLIPGWPRWHGAYNCPLIAVRGSCCSGCAEGKGCDAKTGKGHEDELPVGVGLLGGEKALPWSVAAEFDGLVRQLDTDVRLHGNAGMKLIWLAEIVGFWPRWRAWFNATKNEWSNLGFIAGKNLEEYEAFRAEYNKLLQAFKEGGLETSVTAADVADKSPVEKGLEKGGEALGGVAASVAGTLGTIAWIGAAGLVLYFVGPVLIAKLVVSKAA